MNSSKAISIIAVLQASEVVFGTLAVAVALKTRGYSQGIGSAFSHRSLWVHESGWILIGIPIIWAILSLLISRNRETPNTIIISGFAILLGLLGFYISSLAFAFYGPQQLV